MRQRTELWCFDSGSFRLAPFPTGRGCTCTPRPNRGLTRLILPAIAIAAGALVAGCGDDDEGAAAAKPAPFAITAATEGKKKTLEFPATVKAGLVTMTLTNSDTVPRSAGIARLVGNHTVDEYIDEGQHRRGGRPDPGLDRGRRRRRRRRARRDGRPSRRSWPPANTASPTTSRRAGRAKARASAELGAKGEFTVTGEASDAELPDQPATITATDDGGGDDGDYGFEFKGLKAGDEQGALREHRRATAPRDHASRSTRARRSRTSRRRSRPTGRRRARRRSTSPRSSERRSSTAGSRRTSSCDLPAGQLRRRLLHPGPQGRQAARREGHDRGAHGRVGGSSLRDGAVSGRSSSSPASSSTATFRRSALSSLDPGEAPATT